MGFTFVCGKTRVGKFQIKWKTRADRMRAKLKMIKEELRWRMHQPIPDQGKWLCFVVKGLLQLSRGAHECAGFACVPTPRHRPVAAHAPASQPKDSDPVGTDDGVGDFWLPKPIILHPWRSLCRHTPKVGAVCGKAARTVLSARVLTLLIRRRLRLLGRLRQGRSWLASCRRSAS
jgi:hypothetical protein